MITSERKFDHIMIDLETLSVESNAMIVQIGAVHMHDMNVTYEKKNNFFGDHLFDVNLDTVNFHYKRNPAFLAECRNKQTTLFDNLIEFNRWLSIVCCDRPPMLWMAGTDFDWTILKNAYKILEIKHPLESYSHVRDFRTIRESFKPKFAPFYNNSHDALADAMNQAEHLKLLVERYKLFDWE